MLKHAPLFLLLLATSLNAQVPPNINLISEMCWVTYSDSRKKVERPIKLVHQERVQLLERLGPGFPALEALVKNAVAKVSKAHKKKLIEFQKLKEKHGNVLRRLTVLLRPYDITSSDITEKQFLYAFLIYDQKEIEQIAKTLPENSPKAGLLRFAEKHKDVLQEVRQAADEVAKLDLSRAREHLIVGEEHIQCEKGNDPMIRFQCTNSEASLIRTAKFSFHGNALPILEACNIIDPRKEVPLRLCAAMDFVTGKVSKRIEGVDTEEQHEARIHAASLKGVAETCVDDIERRLYPERSIVSNDAERSEIKEKAPEKKPSDNIFLRGVLKQ